jgi:hypothetical protein
MIEFPVFDDYDMRAMAYEEVEAEGTLTWKDCLKVYESVVYRARVPVIRSDFTLRQSAQAALCQRGLEVSTVCARLGGALRKPTGAHRGP